MRNAQPLKGRRPASAGPGCRSFSELPRPPTAGPSCRIVAEQQRPASARPGGRSLEPQRLSIVGSSSRGLVEPQRPASAGSGGRGRQRTTGLSEQERPASAGLRGCVNAAWMRNLPESARSLLPDKCTKTQQEKQAALRMFMREQVEILQEVRDKGRNRRRASEAVQLSQRHVLTGDPWRNTGACANTVRTATLSRKHGCTTSGLFSDAQLLEGSESSTRLSDSTRSRRKDTDAKAMHRRSCSSTSTVEPWRTTGACAGMARPPCLSRTHGTTTSGLFSDVRLLSESESEASLMESRGHSPSFCARSWRPPQLEKQLPKRNLGGSTFSAEARLDNPLHGAVVPEVDRRLPHERLLAEEPSGTDSAEEEEEAEDAEELIPSKTCGHTKGWNVCPESGSSRRCMAFSGGA